MTNEQKTRRFHKMAKSWLWAEDMMRLVSVEQASVIANVTVEHEALYLPQSGAVSPRALCSAYVGDGEVQAEEIAGLDAIDADIVILACGASVAEFAGLPLKTVRGQVTDIQGSAASVELKVALCYSGYMMPADAHGVHHIGSTFQRWLDYTDILPEDDQDNIDKFIMAVPALAGEYAVVDHRAALRVVAPDHMPVIGRLRDGVYVSAAHGSHGILSSLMGAKILAAQIMGAELPVAERVAERLCPHRF